MVLASASPRRRSLLSTLVAAPHLRVMAADLDEEAVAAGRSPADAVRAVAWAKASQVVTRIESESTPFDRPRLVVAADTTVIGPHGAVGKPTNRDHAQSMILAMADQTITVLTGLVVTGWDSDGGQRVVETRVVSSVVKVHPWTTAEVAAYVATGAADDKAGGLELQGRAAPLVAEHHGCFTNTMGLPLCTTATAMQAAGQPIPMFPECWSFAPPGLQPLLRPPPNPQQLDGCGSVPPSTGQE